MAKKYLDLTTERKVPRLAIDQRPTRLPFIRDRGRLRVVVLGRWWSPWALLALACVGAGIALALLGRAR